METPKATFGLGSCAIEASRNPCIRFHARHGLSLLLAPLFVQARFVLRLVAPGALLSLGQNCFVTRDQKTEVVRTTTYYTRLHKADSCATS